MSLPAVEGGLYEPYSFGKIYAVTGGRGKPIFTPKGLCEAQKQYRSLFDNGTAVFADIFGNTTHITLENVDDKQADDKDNKEDQNKVIRLMEFEHSNGTRATLKIGKLDRVYIDTNGIMDLASQDEVPLTRVAPHVEVEELKKILQMQKRCPLFLKFGWYNTRIRFYEPEEIEQSIKIRTEQWEKSEARKILITALEDNAPKMRQVNKIVCFGLAWILPNPEYHADRYYIQHLAACTIARVLGKAQSKSESAPKEIEVFAQDPMYRTTCKTLLGRLNPKIQVVDHRTAEGLTLVDENTFVISIGTTAAILEPAIDLSRPNGPAAIWTDVWTTNAEEEWYGKKIFGKLPTDIGWASDIEWKYRNSCIQAPVTDDRWFGHPRRLLWEREPDYYHYYDEEQGREERRRDKKTGELLMTEGVPKLDKHGNQIFEKFDTVLLLAEK